MTVRVGFIVVCAAACAQCRGPRLCLGVDLFHVELGGCRAKMDDVRLQVLSKET